MKKVIALICLVCLSVCVFAACGDDAPASLAGKTYVLDDVAIKVSDSMSAEEQKTMKDSLVAMNADYANMTLNEIINDMMKSTIDSLKETNAKFVFKEDGVVESSAAGEETTTGSYENKDGKWFITLDGDTKEVTLSGKAMYISEETDGLLVVMKMVQK